MDPKTPKTKKSKGVLCCINVENNKCSDTLGQQTKKSKILKSKKLPKNN